MKDIRGGELDKTYDSVLQAIPDEENFGTLYERTKEVIEGIVERHQGGGDGSCGILLVTHQLVHTSLNTVSAERHAIYQREHQLRSFYYRC